MKGDEVSARSDLASEVARRLGVFHQPGTKVMGDAIALFAPLGWAMCGYWHMEGTTRAIRAAERGASDVELDDLITGQWNGESQFWLRNAPLHLRKWANADHTTKQLFWDRANLLDKAVEHHLAGAYEASIPIIHAQIEGMSFDLTGRGFFTKSSGSEYLDDETVAGMEANLPVVRRVFSADVRPTARHGHVSRHGVAHGRDLAYATLVNSTKSLVLLASLTEYLPKLADGLADRNREAHEQNVAGSQAVDETGRRVDDRHVPELLKFAYEFDARHLEYALFRTGVFKAGEVMSTLLPNSGLEPSTITHHQDQFGCWWVYRIPAGQVMGYAACLTTERERPFHQVWRWDSVEEPMVPPWVNTSGWRSDDDFPRSPNWEPKLVS